MENNPNNQMLRFQENERNIQRLQNDNNLMKERHKLEMENMQLQMEMMRQSMQDKLNKREEISKFTLEYEKIKLNNELEEKRLKKNEDLNEKMRELERKIEEEKSKVIINPNPYNYIFVGSTIVNGQNHMNLLHSWIHQTVNVGFNSYLLYRGTTHGFAAANFHANCNNQGATLTIVRVNGYIFGGYTPIPWTSRQNYAFDQRSFIFSLTNPTNNPLKLSNTGAHHSNLRSIYDHSSYGPTFGGGHDFHISNNSNANSSSYTNLIHSYSGAPCGHGTTQAHQFLCGSYNFSVSEIEVWKINEIH
eukprot:TRINITY_DN5934_c0_g2_i2.p1 TRINITY_DN5934_c0_g2~~TRINITY_DN5934_c0_g2_i2.p1  ORF type:complete len:317 (+),score=79.26 TRINITY_DN5934_c0_g2_i2:41-952(+)